MLIRPAAVSAFLAALHKSLQLSVDDDVSLSSVEVVAPSGRRLAIGRWQVKMELVLYIAGTSHSAVVANKVQGLSNQTANSGSAFIQAFAVELTKRSMVIRIVVMGASVLNAKQVAAAAAASARSSATHTPKPVAVSAAGSAPEPEGGDSGKTLALVLIIVAASLVLLVCIPLSAVCAQRLFKLSPSQTQVVTTRTSLEEVRSHRHSRDKHHRPSSKQDSAQSSRPSSSSQTSFRSPDPRDPAEHVAREDMMLDSVACKMAWQGSDERPPSGSSTATGGDAQSSSTISGAMASGRSNLVPSRRSAAHISAAPQQLPSPKSFGGSSSAALGKNEQPGNHNASSSEPLAKGTSFQDSMELESVNSGVAPTGAHSALRLAALREAQQPPVPEPGKEAVLCRPGPPDATSNEHTSAVGSRRSPELLS